jgi:dolichyl-phosphate-mannose--protein O-mannosyl transferase
MNWGYFFAWAAAIFFLFFVTGWPVTPSLKESWGNHYNAKNLTYYGVLYLHYLLGPLFFSFLFLGLFRNILWKDEHKKGGNRQLAFLLAYSVLVAAIFAVVLVHRYSPVPQGPEEETTQVPDEVQDANDGKV